MMSKKLFCLCAALLFAFAVTTAINAEESAAPCPCAAKTAYKSVAPCNPCAAPCYSPCVASYYCAPAYYYAPRVVYRAPLFGFLRPVAYPYYYYGYRPYGYWW